MKKYLIFLFLAPTLLFSQGYNQVFISWENHLLKNKILDYVSATDCSNKTKMDALYAAGKYPTHLDSKTILEYMSSNGDTNYIVTYILDNCVGGTTVISDFIFLTSNGGNLVVDKSQTDNLKAQFSKFVQQKFGGDSYVYFDNGYRITNQLIPRRVIEERLFGDFKLLQNGPNCCPEVNGTFEFDLSTRKLEITSMRKEVESNQLTPVSNTYSFIVKAAKTYFHKLPTNTSKSSAYLVQGDQIKIIKATTEYVYATYKNNKGITTKGWLWKGDIAKIKNK